ncbi:Ribokinase-like protein [Aureobasidium pullulans]|uniref:Ribokinase n=1 Tax=Aureobasidium pullulans TaxID=5580 RepID=A0A4S9XB65_AURPU|nr:Ribokinase-like protein [Aureobasidium pullulans]
MPDTFDPPIIAVIGSLNVDIAVYTRRIPDAGETFRASSSAISMAGKGANQAVACAKLSRSRNGGSTPLASVQMIGAVGDDAHGEMILTEVVSLPTPRPDLIIMQLEIPLNTVLQVMETAKTHNVPVLLNPAPAQKIPTKYHDGLAHLVMNETEALFLANFSESDLTTLSGLSTIARKFQGYGVQHVIITLGGRGVFYLDSISGEEGLIQAGQVDVVDTTAAGDTFIGAYAMKIVKGDFKIASAVQKANSAAAVTVQRRGAQQSIPWMDEL